MSSTSIAYTYRYPFSSSIGKTVGGNALHLATSSTEQVNPYFFRGRILQPRVTAQMLLALSEVVRTRYFLPTPDPSTLDPVVTSNDSTIRFEGFSACCGVYVRVDLSQQAFETEFHARGTTNVDFNTSMRTTLGQIKEIDRVKLFVGDDELMLENNQESIVEKKVLLPLRWIKSFSEVQAYLPTMDLKFELSPLTATTFLRSLPKSTQVPRKPGYLVISGRSARLSASQKSGGVAVHGLHRLSSLLPLMPFIRSLRVWADDTTGISGWEILSDECRYSIFLSPESHRGFSGEGQILTALAGNNWKNLLSPVRANLNWQSRIDCAELAGRLDASEDDIKTTLIVLGSHGLAGYDLESASYFHRELPFDINNIETQQPRLRGARKLLEQKGVSLQKKLGNNEFNLSIAGSGLRHFVELRKTGDRCTCPWFSRYLGQRGICKHILAARLFVDKEVDLQ
jgi:hypothetical protein